MYIVYRYIYIYNTTVIPDHKSQDKQQINQKTIYQLYIYCLNMRSFGCK